MKMRLGEKHPAPTESVRKDQPEPTTIRVVLGRAT